MKIKNMKNSVIGIGTIKTLLPEEEAEISKEVFELDSVQALVSKGFLTVIGKDTEPAKAVEAEVSKADGDVAELPEDEANDEVSVAKAEKKKGGSKK